MNTPPKVCLPGYVEFYNSTPRTLPSAHYHKPFFLSIILSYIIVARTVHASLLPCTYAVFIIMDLGVSGHGMRCRFKRGIVAPIPSARRVPRHGWVARHEILTSLYCGL